MQTITYTCPDCGTVVAANELELTRMSSCPRLTCENVLREGTPGEVYNVGSGDELTNLEVANRILAAVGAPDDLIEFVDDWPGHDQRYVLNTSKLSSLGWEPEWSLKKGFGRTIEYYR